MNHRSMQFHSNSRNIKAQRCSFTSPPHNARSQRRSFHPTLAIYTRSQSSSFHLTLPIQKHREAVSLPPSQYKSHEVEEQFSSLPHNTRVHRSSFISHPRNIRSQRSRFHPTLTIKKCRGAVSIPPSQKKEYRGAVSI